MERISFSLNQGIELLYDVLNRKVSLSDNIACTIRDVIVSVNAGGIPLTRTSYSLDLVTTVIGTEVIRAENLTNSTIYPSSGILISYTQSGSNIIINHITGLQADSSYRIRVITWQS